MSQAARGRRKHGRRPFWQKRRAADGVVGTEAAALENLERNRRHFSYPPEGFVDKIEYSLLYNMISESSVYPEEVVRKEIEEEDFETYMEVAAAPSSKMEEEPRISYAQLSAILALSAEKNPPEAQARQEDDNDEDERRGDDQPPGIPQMLCKAVLQTVVRYAAEHDLDRAVEVQELMDPVEKYCVNEIDKTELKGIVPLYVGYAASVMTGNPLPLLVGTSLSIAQSDNTAAQRVNVSAFQSETKRKGDVETTSLLDEADDLG